MQENNAIKLSYLRYYNNIADNADLKLFIVKSSYCTIKRNNEELSDTDFTELCALLSSVYNQLCKIDKFKKQLNENMIDILNTILRNKKMNIDLYRGLSLHNGIVLFYDGSRDTTSLIRHIARVNNGNV